MMEKEIITHMLQIEKRASKMVEESKERSNRLLVDARTKTHDLIDSTKMLLSQDKETLKKCMQGEAEKEIEQIEEQKIKILQEMGKNEAQKKEGCIEKIRGYLFNNVTEETSC